MRVRKRFGIFGNRRDLLCRYLPRGLADRKAFYGNAVRFHGFTQVDPEAAAVDTQRMVTVVS